MLRTVMALVACVGSLSAAACRTACCPQKIAPLPCPAHIEVGAGLEAQVFLDLHVIEVPEARLAVLLGEAAPEGAVPRVLVPAQAAALLQRIQADSTVKFVNAPKMLALVDQDASVSVGETDFDGTWRGFRAAVRPRLAPAPNVLKLDVAVTHRPGDAATEQRVAALGQRIESGLTLVLLGEPRRDGGPRFVMTITPTLMLPPT